MTVLLCWVEHADELHVWVIPQNSKPTEIIGPDLAEALRGLFRAIVRTKVDIDAGFASRMRGVESHLIEQYRIRTQADVESGIRYAVFPLAAIVLSE